MRTVTKNILRLATLSAALTLAACGGNENNATPVPTENPCVGVTCDAKTPICMGDTAVTYGAGMCTEGTCEYAETETDCAADGKVCMDGACVKDPCADVTCEAKPSECRENVAVTYDAGVCAEGTCEYAETETDCAALDRVCMEGVCVDTTAEDPDPTCQNYCDTVMANCTGTNQQYSSPEECMAYCNDTGGWAEGTKGDVSGNTIACRIYHGNIPAAADPTTHCSHAGPTGANVCGTWCDVYCGLSFDHCEGPNKHYDNDAECQAACAGFDATGEPGDVQYDTVQCRVYHLGAPATADPDLHCSHGAEEPDAFCVGAPTDFVFRDDAFDAYTRVDRSGMPAVSTALITDKNGYNDQDPVEDADLANNPYVTEIVTNLTAVHSILDDDLMMAGLTPCSMMDNDMDGLPDCVGQAVVAGGPSVVSLVIPDHVSIDPAGAAGFPNGRRLQDPVMDVTLAIILLDMTTHTPTTLAELPLNPAANDKGVEGAFLTSFPYLHPPH